MFLSGVSTGLFETLAGIIHKIIMTKIKTVYERFRTEDLI